MALGYTTVRKEFAGFKSYIGLVSSVFLGFNLTILLEKDVNDVDWLLKY